MEAGGKRKGAGRKRGTKNKSTVEVKELIDSVVDMRVLMEKMFELVQGVMIEKTFKTGETIIYKLPPDAFAAKTILEYRYGKAKQQLEVDAGEKIFDYIIGKGKDTDT